MDGAFLFSLLGHTVNQPLAEARVIPTPGVERNKLSHIKGPLLGCSSRKRAGDSSCGTFLGHPDLGSRKDTIVAASKSSTRRTLFAHDTLDPPFQALGRFGPMRCCNMCRCNVDDFVWNTASYM